MSKNFLFYEFAGIITPSVVLLYFLDFLLKRAYQFTFFDYSDIGGFVVFIIIAYGLGQVLHSLGNIFELILWWLFNGQPTQWLTKEPHFSQTLFDEHESNKITEKLYSEFGKVAGKDYGRLAYTKVYSATKSGRIDTFNGNYSLFRALTVSFLLLMILTICLGFFKWSFVPLIFFIMSLSRMIRFAKHYAREVYRTYLIVG